MFCVQAPLSGLNVFKPYNGHLAHQISDQFERGHSHSFKLFPILTAAIVNNGEPKAGQKGRKEKKDTIDDHNSIV